MRVLPLLIMAAVFWIGLCFLIGKIAAAYRRRASTWVLIALIASPLVALILLVFLGDPETAVEQQEKEERLRQLHPDRKDIREAALNEMQCPTCGAIVNPVTGDGLHTPESEPWRLRCNQCKADIQPDV